MKDDRVRIESKIRNEVSRGDGGGANKQKNVPGLTS